MFLIRTSIRRSPIHGFGVCAEEDVREGEAIWRFVPGFDQVLPVSVLSTLPLVVQEHVRHFCYCGMPGEFFLLTVDNDRFVNHSETPTMRFCVETMEGYALRDISIGEELTEDYRLSGWRGDESFRPDATSMNTVGTEGEPQDVK